MPTLTHDITGQHDLRSIERTPLERSEWAAVITIVVLVPIATAFLIVRVWLQHRVGRSWRVPENVCLIVATVGLCIFCGAWLAAMFTGVFSMTKNSLCPGVSASLPSSFST